MKTLAKTKVAGFKPVLPEVTSSLNWSCVKMVWKIICIGLNYADHAAEAKHAQ